MTDTTKQEQQLATAKDKAVVDAHPVIRSFLASRKFDDEGFVRAVIVEYIKHDAEMKFKPVVAPIDDDDEL